MSAEIKKILPSVVTAGNLLCGFWAIILIISDTGAYTAAAWWIIIAGFLDGLDGKLARLTGTSSRFGVEFDSLADLTSFGVAPALLIYHSKLYMLGFFGILTSFAFLLCGALRLARFNLSVASFKKENFTGIPIPAAAGILASYTLFHSNVVPAISRVDFSLFLTLMASFLMVSTIEYPLLPKVAVGSLKDNIRTLLFIGVAVTFILFPDELFFPVVCVYVIIGLYHRVHPSTSEEAISVSADG